MWSPQRKRNGGYNQYYENMRSVQPGDVVLSYVDGEIYAVGVALSTAYESPKPAEFGAAGNAWADLGWRVDVQFQQIEVDSHFRVRPADFLSELMATRPEKYSPLNADGTVQTQYLFELPDDFAEVLVNRLEVAPAWHDSQALRSDGRTLRTLGEDIVEQFLRRAPLDETEKATLIAARRGQGRFREGVSLVEPACRFTGVTNPGLLVASHIQPWHRCHTNADRLDPYNGLMLTPTYDRLFDRGLVTFSPDSRLVVSPRLPAEDVRKIRMDPDLRTHSFHDLQQKYLAYHRDNVFQVA
jgi:hypothetical protein